MTTHKTACLPTLSRRVKGSDCSIIRDLLQLVKRPEIVSFAGGLPTADGFPIQEIDQAAHWVMDNCGREALQYSLTEGELELRRAIAQRESLNGVPTSVDEVQIVSGSQQALDLIARAFVDEGSKILVENPTYMGALQAFARSSPTFADLPCDEQGLNPEEMDESLKGAAFAYVMPTFANPTGLTMSEMRRQQLAEKARELDLWLVEDDPYGELWYDNHPPKSLRAWAPERTLRLGTLSKVLSPGFRIGYICGPREALDVICRLKQATDLHTSTFTQRIAAKVLCDGLLTEHLPRVRHIYKSQCHAMLEALEKYMPRHPDISWTHPEGGMFIWMTLPEGIDTSKLMIKALENNVAFVPGAVFYTKNGRNNNLRLSFVTVPIDRIDSGIRSLSAVIAQAINEGGIPQ